MQRRFCCRAAYYLRPIGALVRGVDLREAAGGAEAAGLAELLRRVEAALCVFVTFVLRVVRCEGRVERVRRRAGIAAASVVPLSLFLPKTPEKTLTIGAICPTVLTTFCTVVTVLRMPSSPPKRSTNPFNSSTLAYLVKLARLKPLEAGLASFSFSFTSAAALCAG